MSAKAKLNTIFFTVATAVAIIVGLVTQSIWGFTLAGIISVGVLTSQRLIRTG